uniref:Uncharacterized protein n=1 Tax=Rhizophora mucronata TaxID=61149 RepID=A0A2P2PKH5_RHIMU
MSTLFKMIPHSILSRFFSRIGRSSSLCPCPRH